jgi:3-phosphoshikimate 1-carboxyvinyltransferase
MTLVKTHDFKFEDVDFELNNTQILHKLLCCLVLAGIGCHLTGLHTLKLKKQIG